MTLVKPMRHPNPDEMALVEVMGAPSDPIRVGLARVLADDRERGWGELRAPVSKSTLSHHLRVLRDAGHHPNPPGGHALLRDPSPR